MNYKPRPGIVMTKICGFRVLVPTRAASEHCSSLLRLPLLWAITYELLGQEDGEERILKAHQIFTKQPEDVIRANVERFCEDMAKKGFLIREDSVQP